MGHSDQVPGGKRYDDSAARLGSKLDPSSNDGISDKMGIDATIPLDADPLRFERIRIPGENSVRLEDYIDKRQK